MAWIGKTGALSWENGDDVLLTQSSGWMEYTSHGGASVRPKREFLNCTFFICYPNLLHHFPLSLSFFLLPLVYPSSIFNSSLHLHFFFLSFFPLSLSPLHPSITKNLNALRRKSPVVPLCTGDAYSCSWATCLENLRHKEGVEKKGRWFSNNWQPICLPNNFVLRSWTAFSVVITSSPSPVWTSLCSCLWEMPLDWELVCLQVHYRPSQTRAVKVKSENLL